MPSLVRRPRVAQLLAAVTALSACGPHAQDPPAPPDAHAPKVTHHGQDPDRPVNRLAESTSPYLLQHRHNPVDWYPWGAEALQRAKDEDRVIFLSIGYAACHWCHVMERESFEDPKMAETLNERFVCIKVDREERPDLDEIYMASTQAMSGSGGWPMTVFMTPDLKPFYAGTYFPPDERMGMPSFRRVVDHVHRLWTEEREAVLAQGEKVADYLRKSLAPAANPADPTLEFAGMLRRQSLERFDDEHGGFGQEPRFAPKFPHASELTALLREHARSGDAESLAAVELTLERMAAGGMYDQLGGGFHRYSVDRIWLVPHFEKMLYDNGQLVRTYAEAWRVTGKERYREIVVETLDYLLREMQDPAGGFWSTQDADSEGVEGKFFVWDKSEVEAVCGDDAAVAIAHLGVRDGGNWEGHNVFHVARSLDEVATELGLERADVDARWRRAKAALFARRAERIKPGTDDKVLAAWNGMGIAACSIGYQVTGDDRYLEAARRAATFVLTEMRDDAGRLFRTWRGGRAQLTGYLEDYAFLADGLLHLFESDFDPRWLAAASELLAHVTEHFRDDADGNFFFTADDHEQLIARTKSVQESSQPSGIAMAVLAYVRLGLLLGDSAIVQRGVDALRANHDMLSRFPIACPSLVLGVELVLGDPTEVVIAGDPADERTQALLASARASYPPHGVIAVVHDGNREALAKLAPIVDGKLPLDGAPAVYVCRQGVCDAPTTEWSGRRR